MGRRRRTGGSRSIRIPKTLIDQAHFRDVVHLDVEHGALVVRCADSPRAGWDAEFARMADAGDDALLDAGRHGGSKWDDVEWKWK